MTQEFYGPKARARQAAKKAAAEKKAASLLDWLGTGEPDALGFVAIDPVKWDLLAKSLKIKT